MDKEKYNFPCPAREQATRLTQASPVTEWEQACPMGWTGSLLTDLLQLLPACGTDLSQPPCLELQHRQSRELLLNLQPVSSQRT